MPTFWKRPTAYSDTADSTMVVHTPEEAVLATRDGDEWLAVTYTETAAAALARSRGAQPWVQVEPPVTPVKAAKRKGST